MNAAPDPDDMAAIAAEGDLVEYLLSLAGRSRKRAKEPIRDEAAAVDPADFGPAHRPGAWPAGTRPAGPNTCAPDCGCALNNPPPRGLS